MAATLALIALAFFAPGGKMGVGRLVGAVAMWFAGEYGYDRFEAGGGWFLFPVEPDTSAAQARRVDLSAGIIWLLGAWIAMSEVVS